MPGAPNKCRWFLGLSFCVGKTQAVLFMQSPHQSITLEAPPRRCRKSWLLTLKHRGQRTLCPFNDLWMNRFPQDNRNPRTKYLEEPRSRDRERISLVGDELLCTYNCLRFSGSHFRINSRFIQWLSCPLRTGRAAPPAMEYFSVKGILTGFESALRNSGGCEPRD